jgi:lipoprotein signal peptidase
VDRPDEQPELVIPTSADLGGTGEPPVVAIDAAAAEPPRLGVKWWLILLIVTSDQITKALVRNAVPLYDSKTLVPGFVDLAHVRNEGVAFGLFNSMDLPYKWAFTTALALAALLGITYYARHIRPSERLARIGLSMILGGALGNLIDRVWPATSWTSSTSTGAAGTSGRSTSLMVASASAPCSSSSISSW